MAKKLVSIIIPTRNRKRQLIRCLNSLKKISYTHTETIIIDNASTDGTIEIIKKQFPKVKIMRLTKNKGAVGGRNAGIRIAKGDYLLFVDDDNIVTRLFLDKLVELAESDPEIGFVGPKMYYYQDKKRIWFAGVKFNLLTSRTHYIGINQIDCGQFNQVREIDQIPNVWLVKRRVVNKVGGLDENYVMSYGESDWPMRAKLAGFKVLFCPGSVVYHDIVPPKNLKENILLRATPYRAYYFARNRILFMRRFATKLNFLIFLFLFNNCFAIFYLYSYLKGQKYSLCFWHLRGMVDGFLNRSYTFKD